MPQIKAAAGYKLLYRILKDICDKGADIIAVVCPVCQLNLDIYQRYVNKYFNTDFDIPVLFFTQLMGLAFGASHTSVGIGKEMVSSSKVLSKRTNLQVDDKKRLINQKSACPCRK